VLRLCGTTGDPLSERTARHDQPTCIMTSHEETLLCRFKCGPDADFSFMLETQPRIIYSPIGDQRLVQGALYLRCLHPDVISALCQRHKLHFHIAILMHYLGHSTDFKPIGPSGKDWDRASGECHKDPKARKVEAIYWKCRKNNTCPRITGQSYLSLPKRCLNIMRYCPRL
jgi:hypothetical protein